MDSSGLDDKVSKCIKVRIVFGGGVEESWGKEDQLGSEDSVGATHGWTSRRVHAREGVGE